MIIGVINCLEGYEVYFKVKGKNKIKFIYCCIELYLCYFNFFDYLFSCDYDLFCVILRIVNELVGFVEFKIMII